MNFSSEQSGCNNWYDHQDCIFYRPNDLNKSVYEISAIIVKYLKKIIGLNS